MKLSKPVNLLDYHRERDQAGIVDPGWHPLVIVSTRQRVRDGKVQWVLRAVNETFRESLFITLTVTGGTESQAFYAWSTLGEIAKASGLDQNRLTIESADALLGLSFAALAEEKVGRNGRPGIWFKYAVPLDSIPGQPGMTDETIHRIADGMTKIEAALADNTIDFKDFRSNVPEGWVAPEFQKPSLSASGLR